MVLVYVVDFLVNSEVGILGRYVDLDRRLSFYVLGSVTLNVHKLPLLLLYSWFQESFLYGPRVWEVADSQ